MINFEKITLRFGIPVKSPMTENLIDVYARKSVIPFILNLGQGPVIQTQEASIKDAKIKDDYIILVMDCRNGQVDSAWCFKSMMLSGTGVKIFPEVECLSVS